MKEFEIIKMSFVSLQRLMRIFCKLIESNGEIDNFEKSTIMYLFNQCKDVEKEFLIEKFGDTLEFLKTNGRQL